MGYIKRQDAIDAIKSVTTGNWSSKRYAGEIEKIPPADVRPVVRGKWVRKETTVAHWYECSNCRLRRPRSNWGREWSSDYCPGCGADMRGGDAE